MTQIAIYQQEQTALISRMAESLSSDLVEKAGKSIAMAIGKSYQGLQNSLDEFMAFATREQVRGVDLVIQRFMQQMNAAVDGQFQQLAQTLEETGRNQVKLNDYLRQSIEGLGQVSHNIVQAAQLSSAFATPAGRIPGKVERRRRSAGDNQERLAANRRTLGIGGPAIQQLFAGSGPSAGPGERVSGPLSSLWGKNSWNPSVPAARPQPSPWAKPPLR